MLGTSSGDKNGSGHVDNMLVCGAQLQPLHQLKCSDSFWQPICNGTTATLYGIKAA
jgi:hypothetical protein